MPYADNGSRNVLVLNNAKIYYFFELTQMCLDAGMLLVYLPAYLPDYNSIKSFFAVLKRYIQKNATLINIFTEDMGGFEEFLRHAVEAQNEKHEPGALF